MDHLDAKDDTLGTKAVPLPWAPDSLLERLEGLREYGILSDEEVSKERARIMGKEGSAE
jgi:hypothetical protein